MTTEEKFWSKVKKTKDCWLWTDSPASKSIPYGRFFDGKKTYRAHRFVMMMKIGHPIPPSIYVCHKCDTPMCVNPDHLFLGTAQENVNDMILKGRGAKQKKAHCPQGHALTIDNIRLSRNKNGNYFRRCKICSRNRKDRRLKYAKLAGDGE